MLPLRLCLKLRAAVQAGTSSSWCALSRAPDSAQASCSFINIDPSNDLWESQRRWLTTSSPPPARIAPPRWQLTRASAYQPAVNHDPMSPLPATLASGPLTVSYPTKSLTDYMRDQEVLIYNLNGQLRGVMLLKGSVFNVPVRIDILHRCVRYLRALWQQGTHSAKTRATARGGGRKPWQQKGTGRARHGSIRSPLWKGGGAAFGPTPRSHAHKLYANVRRMGLKCALSAKVNEGRLVVVDSLSPAENALKTKVMQDRLQKLMGRMHAKTALLVDSDDRAIDGGVKLRRAAGNLENIDIMSVDKVNVYQLLRSHALIISRPALEMLAEQLSRASHPRRKPVRAAWWAQQQEAFKAATQELLAATPR